MKRIFKKLILWSLVMTLIAAGLGFAFRDQLEASVRHYMTRRAQESILRYGPGLPTVDEVRLIHIEESHRGQLSGHTMYGLVKHQTCLSCQIKRSRAMTRRTLPLNGEL